MGTSQDASAVSGALNIPDPLFVFELANNHMGEVDHGVRVINEISAISKEFSFRCAFKLQYRELDSFIHPDFKNRMDIKYIKRFSETRLDRKQTSMLVDAIKKNGLLAMCTPFDETSVQHVVEDGFDILKVASCSFTDWPLLECIAEAELPIIASTAGADLTSIDNVVAFLSNRKKSFALMACVAEYPTPVENLQLSQIDVLRHRYPGVRVGYSTHESPDEVIPVAMAIAKGATIFEKHVGVTTEQHALNTYSANPQQVRLWLHTAQKAQQITGVAGQRVTATKAEQDSLFSLRRGAYARRPIKKGEPLTNSDVFFASPTQEGHVTANDWSKYKRYTAVSDIPANGAVLTTNTESFDSREEILSIANNVKELIRESRAVIPGEAALEISHHYGIEKFRDFGITMVTVVNRDYCKKLIVVLPGQQHPEQYHEKKEETFHVLYGELRIVLDGRERLCKPGDVIVVTPGMRHAFDSKTGAVFEEISSTHFVDDSYYTDPRISENRNRKTFLRYWM